MFIKDNKAIIGKMEELCSLMLEQKVYGELKQMLDRFAADETAIKQYEAFMEMGHDLLEKQQQGVELTEQEVEIHRQQERLLYNNEVIRQYLFARREFDSLKQMLGQIFDKTVELGRLPEPSKLKKATRGCGSHN